MENRRDNMKQLQQYIRKRKELQRSVCNYEKEIFRLETLFLDMTQGFPVTKNLDYYLNFKVEKKKGYNKDKDRIFSRNIPRINEDIVSRGIVRVIVSRGIVTECVIVIRMCYRYFEEENGFIGNNSLFLSGICGVLRILLISQAFKSECILRFNFI
ncbi:hypothetical protein CWI37_1951p0010 [Hamiltosporidium tvaerminnensis]|uniref:Chromatin modification-related protein EAF6 n=1 Tax=Hamiltosporidium tvaerminnensis TaxID=1176355 RepID=A0A4Q9KTB1_9MICR|nr:hypothetical protein CWI37_1951p0010 [Hamiltosporidium tvaerminnensis]